MGKFILSVLTVITVVFMIVTIILTAVSIKRKENLKIENNNLVAQYPAEVEKHLEKKYGEKFIVDPVYVLHSRGPIPFLIDYAPYEYEVKEAGEDGYEFTVYLYPESVDDNHIKEFRDDYCWKYYAIKTKSFFTLELQDVLPNEYKLIFQAGLTDTFDDSIRQDTRLDRYFGSSKYPEEVSLFMVIPPKAGNNADQITADRIYSVLLKFYKENNCKINFHYNQTKTMDDYNKIDIRQFENSMYLTSTTEYDKLWSLLNEKNTMDVTVDIKDQEVEYQ